MVSISYHLERIKSHEFIQTDRQPDFQHFTKMVYMFWWSFRLAAISSSLRRLPRPNLNRLCPHRYSTGGGACPTSAGLKSQMCQTADLCASLITMSSSQNTGNWDLLVERPCFCKSFRNMRNRWGKPTTDAPKWWRIQWIPRMLKPCKLTRKTQHQCLGTRILRRTQMHFILFGAHLGHFFCIFFSNSHARSSSQPSRYFFAFSSLGRDGGQNREKETKLLINNAEVTVGVSQKDIVW